MPAPGRESLLPQGLPDAAQHQVWLLGCEKPVGGERGRGSEMSQARQWRGRSTPPLLQNQTAFKAECYMQSSGSLRALDIVRSLSLPCFSVSRKTKMQVKTKQKKTDLRKNFFLSLFFSLVFLHMKRLPSSSTRKTLSFLPYCIYRCSSFLEPLHTIPIYLTTTLARY